MMQSLVNALEDSRIIKEGDKMAILVERNSADFIKLTSDKFDNHWKIAKSQRLEHKSLKFK